MWFPIHIFYMSFTDYGIKQKQNPVRNLIFIIPKEKRCSFLHLLSLSGSPYDLVLVTLFLLQGHNGGTRHFPYAPIP